MEKSERIQNYLLNKMTVEELAVFENEVEADEELALQVEMQRFEMETIDQLEEDTLREKAKGLKAKTSSVESEGAVVRQMKPGRIRSLGILVAAASVLLLIVFLLFQNPSFSIDDALSMGYEKGKTEYSVFDRAGSEEAVFENRFLEILQNRDQENAQDAIDYFSGFSSTDPAANLQAQVNLAHAYILNKEFSQAITLFSTLETSPQIDGRKKEEIAYYKALAILAQDKARGIIQIENIIQQNSRFSPAARSILDQLK